MQFLFGIQQLQLGKACTSTSEVRKALISLKESHFDFIELDGFMIRKTPLFARMLLSLSGMGIKKSQKLPWGDMIKEANLSVLSIHEDLETLENNFELVAEEIAKYGPHYIVITGMYNFSYDDEGELGRLIVRLNRVGRKLKGLGVEFLYHNHSVEFQTIEGDTKAFDILISGLNPEWVNFEFDSYWAIEAGADPLYWMDKLGSRMKLYHICDRGNVKKGPYLTPILKTDAVELGFGSINLRALIEKALEYNVSGIILEQHKNYYAKDPVISAKRSALFIAEHFKKQK